MLSLLNTVHHRLSRPHSSIQVPTDKITAQFLAMWSFYGAFIAPTVYVLWNTYNEEPLSHEFLVGTAILSIIIYSIARSRYWKTGFWLQCMALWLSPIAAILDLPDLHATYITFIFSTIFCAAFVRLKQVIAVAICAQCIAVAVWISPIGQLNPAILSPLMILTVLQLMTILLKKYVETLSQHAQASQRAQELAHIKQLMNTFDIVLVEKEGAIIQWSPDAPTILGCSPQDFERGFEACIAHSPSISQDKESLIIGDQHHYHIYIDQRSSQKIISLRNISHLKDKLLRQDTLFKNSALGLITKGLAHELNNPLMHMTLSLEQLEKNLSNSTIPNQDRHLQSFQNGLAHIHAVTQDLRMLADGQKVKSTRIADCLKSTLNLCGTTLKQHKITVAQNIQSDAIVMASAGQLGQLFLNIIQNAIFAMNERPTKTITIYTTTTEQDILLSFEDTGVGIPEENINMLFTPHFSTRPPTQGSGMGLYICRQIVEELNGSIDIGNTETGAKIQIRIPRVTQAGKTIPRSSPLKESKNEEELSMLSSFAPDLS